MSIASAITAAQGRVADCYTAISNKGGTLPATQNLANMPTAINSIPSGGGSTKYGADINTVVGDINASGVLTYPSGAASIVFTGVEDINENALIYKFYNNTAITSVSFPDLTAISGQGACNYAFSNCTNITSISFPELVTISGGCQRMFSGCSNLTSISLPELTTISGTNAVQYLFYGCTKLETVSLPKLKTISGGSSCQYLFYNTKIQTITFDSLESVAANNIFLNAFSLCASLKNVYFPALKTTSFGSYTNQMKMFNSGTASTQNPCMVHFPSNLQTVVSGLDGYPLFGGSSGKILVSFDLTATS